jgi:hypothetical protein
VASQHCRDWHGVERLMARIETDLFHTPADAPGRSAAGAQHAAA